jgi:high-affinity K+ transport system ATPase subunit B
MQAMGQTMLHRLLLKPMSSVAMNTGTQAAKEAWHYGGSRLSYPTKLIEIVQIGKQMLMTRGCAHDVLNGK